MKNQNTFQGFKLLLLVTVVLFVASDVRTQSRNYANPDQRPKIVCGYETRAFGATAGKLLTSLNEAKDILHEVLNTAGIDKSSVDIYEANVGDRLAVACPLENGKTIILFDAVKLNEKISSGGNLVIKSIFAHEAGHIYYKHSSKIADQAELESEADMFAGKILAKLKANLVEVTNAYEAWVGEDKLYLEKRITTYPLPSKRLKDVESGWREVRITPSIHLKSKKVAFYLFIHGGTDQIKPEDIYYVSGDFQAAFANRLCRSGLTVFDSSIFPEGYDPLMGTEDEEILNKLPFASVIAVWVGDMEDLPKERGMFVSKVQHVYLEVSNVYTGGSIGEDSLIDSVRGVGKTQEEARMNALKAVADAFSEEVIQEIVSNSQL
jgi:hypothetical protein